MRLSLCLAGNVSIMIRNLRLTSFRSEVIDYCQKFGTVKSVYIPMNMQLGIHRRMAIVRFKDESAVKKILALPAESHIIDGNVVQISKTADEHWNK
uniref:RRM domain-containing protein n=1 Tax=Syphacia muris TaxID=451379 RepID=A0A0N5AXW5_9BILA